MPQTASFFIGARATATRSPELMRLVVREIDANGVWCRAHEDELAAIMSGITGVNLAAQAVTAHRGSFGAALMSDAVVARQQQVADMFADAHLIPGRVRVRDAVWLPPAA